MLQIKEVFSSSLCNKRMLKTRKRQRQIRHIVSGDNILKELSEKQWQIPVLVQENSTATNPAGNVELPDKRSQSDFDVVLQTESSFIKGEILEEEKATVIVGSPQARQFSFVQNLVGSQEQEPGEESETGSDWTDVVVFPENLELNRKMKEVKKEKKVSFSKDTKTWDGLTPINTDFDELLYCFLVKGQSIGDGDVLKWTSEDCHKIFLLCQLLNDLIARLRKKTAESLTESKRNKREKQVPCLPQGGGRAMRVEKAYEPYLISLLSVLATALKLATTSPRRKNYEEIADPADLEMLEHFVENKSNLNLLVLSK